MWYYIVIPFIAVAALVLGFGGYNMLFAKQVNTTKKSTPKSITTTRVVTNGVLTRAELTTRLKAIAQGPTPSLDPNMISAMCYEPAMPPDRTEYVCPKDGSKTIYMLGDAEFVEWWIPTIRETVKNFRRVKLTMDESEFCKKCHPEAVSPTVYVYIHFSGDKNPYKLPVRNYDDLRLVAQFINGEAFYTDGWGNQTPMKGHVDALKELLNIDIK